MDSLINAAARALAVGDPLRALKHVALRDDAPALALRGAAMAQLGDLVRARELFRRAIAAFGPRDPLARARCVLAEAELALVSRDLARPPRGLDAARSVLARHGDRLNAAHAACLEARRLLLVGRLDAAEELLSRLDPEQLPPPLRATRQLAVAGIAIRRVRTAEAGAALAQAAADADASGIATLRAEVAEVATLLDAPVARMATHAVDRPLLLAEVEALLASDALVVDATRNVVRQGAAIVALARRPVLFALARALAEAWPGDVGRDVLVRRAFGGREADESHRARLRVEIGRLRAELGALAEVNATERGFVLSPGGERPVAVLAPLAEDKHADVLALLADGESWSSSALAIALGVSARSVQRALETLARQGKAQSVGEGPARRWITPPVPGFPTTLLLPGPLPGG